MITIPIQTGKDTYRIAVILEDENIDRIKKYDPAQIDFAKYADHFRGLRCEGVDITYATAEEAKRAGSVHTREQGIEYLRLLMRGFKFRPELGDSDGPYQNANKQ